MANYLDTLNATQRSNVEFIIQRMAQKGITNAYMQAGILAVVSKESTFIPKSERDYSNTSNDRIRKIFGSRVSSLNDAQLTALKNDPKAFFDKIYGGRYGNAADEGYKYRGRGFNQLTFKGNYKNVNPYTSVDIVANPDKVNDLSVATDLLIGFFEKAFQSSSAKLTQYNMNDINSATSTKDAVGAAYNANAGWGKSKAAIEADPTGGYKKATGRVDDFYTLTKTGGTSPAPSSVSKPTTVPTATPTSTIELPPRGYFKKGDKGPAVEQVQRALDKAGFWTYSKFTEYYGDVTKAAVINFQKSKGLSPDGLMGKDTLKKLLSA